ncbi:putative E3 ubiquitin-protein ligase RING1a [Cynara cardunculus var. scolymus]|uniref:putative E3 ubiquitin-protein ligase RING1a n=1 Tax=Cynara cardunculus var. scolymus TaxID=59895 RepID=UPI000D631459|nr:putative E3 ubiquitin-protein ligase RING1a [Cynara cardunculus var. scolymus]
MEARKQSEDLRRNSRKQQRPQQEAMGKKYQLVDEESKVDIEEEQTHEDAAMVRVDAENELEAADDESDGIPSDVGELDEKHCPSCRKSYGTNRVLRNDPNMDSIIEVVIGDIGKYDREVLNNNAEEVHQRQPVNVTEVLNDIGNTSTGRSVKRSSNGQQNAHARKRTHRSRTLKRYANQNEIDHDPVIQNEHQQDQVNKNETNCNEGDEKKEDNEIMEEIKQLKSKKLKRFSQDSSTDTDIEYGERNISGGVVSNTETPSSGGAAARFHRSLSGARRIRNTRLTKLAKHLRLREQKKKKNDQVLSFKI